MHVCCKNAVYRTVWFVNYTTSTYYHVNRFTKTLLFCANFLRKMTKIRISDQLTVFCYLMHNISSICKNTLYVNRLLIMLIMWQYMKPIILQKHYFSVLTFTKNNKNQKTWSITVFCYFMYNVSDICKTHCTQTGL
jgi:hypothetical protein